MPLNFGAACYAVVTTMVSVTCGRNATLRESAKIVSESRTSILFGKTGGRLCKLHMPTEQGQPRTPGVHNWQPRGWRLLIFLSLLFLGSSVGEIPLQHSIKSGALMVTCTWTYLPTSRAGILAPALMHTHALIGFLQRQVGSPGRDSLHRDFSGTAKYCLEPQQSTVLSTKQVISSSAE